MRNFSGKIHLYGLLLALSVFPFSNLLSFESETYFKTYLSVEDGLSQSEVTSIVRDRFGFIWLGTRGGLNRYDGYNFVQYKPAQDTPQGIQSPSIETLMSDSVGNIWIGTKSGGLGVFDVLASRFVRPDSLAGKFPSRIIAFFEDREGKFWIGSWQGGLFRYDPVNARLEHFLGQDRVSSIIQTADGTMWAGTSSGLRYKKPGATSFGHASIGEGYMEVTEMVESPADSCLWMVGWNVGLTRFDYIDFSYSRHQFAPGLSLKASTYSLLGDDQMNLWVGTWGNGLFKYNALLDNSMKIELMPSEFKTSTDYEIILDLFQDPSGDLWIGTDGGGVVKLSFNKLFHNLFYNKTSHSELWHVNSVLESHGELWIGTRSNGLFVTRDMLNFERVGFIPGQFKNRPSPFAIRAIHSDSAGRLWVGDNGGLYLVAKRFGDKRFLIPASEVLNSDDLKLPLKVMDIKAFNGELWVATQQSGFYVFSVQDDRYRLKKRFYAGDGENSLMDSRVSGFAKDMDGNIWISTYKGLYRYQKGYEIPVNVNHLIDGINTLLCDIILSCEIDDSNRIWVGTPCGLYSLTKNGNGFYRLREYGPGNGLNNEYVNAIETHNGRVWVSTNFGISSLDPEQGIIRNYGVSDGVGGFNFSENASCKSPDGTIYFGGNSDLTWFNPEIFQDNPPPPVIVFTNFKILNQEVDVGENSVLKTSINEAQSVTLNYKQKEFSFEIAALDFTSPENNQYAYRLFSEKDSGNWVYTGKRRHISFNNLRPGDYTLHIAGANGNGVWNRDGRSIDIKILPPPWKTWYAFVIYLMVLLLIVTLINSATMQQDRLKNRIKLEHMARVQEHDLNEAKLKFFTDITHEIKTPVSLIQGPVEELRNRDFESISKGFFRHRVDLIFKSSSRLTALLNQLLEFRKVEAGKAQLQAAEINIADFVENLSAPYKSLAIRKEISFEVCIRIRDKFLWFDPSKMEIILSNLLSNAFKYCGKPGVVRLGLSDSDTEVFISVENDGQNISVNEMGRLFDRFYQATGHATAGGGGIGLFLVKSFVELHKGHIAVYSENGALTCFKVGFLKGSNHFDESQKIEAVMSTGDKKEIPNMSSIEAGVQKKLPAKIRGSKVLVVEDNDEVRDYLVTLLESHFEVMEAADGLAGFEAILAHNPDLVISDVMMPKSDGYELCERVKSNPQTLDIPVVLLTAKGNREDQLMGTRKGADAYLTKPFDPALLFEKIRQLISLRAAMTEKFRKIVTLEPLNKEIKSEDELFLKKVIAIIEKHMGNQLLDSDFVAGEVGMSASTFYRKLKKVVAQSPGEFIKGIRMKKAARYLTDTSLTVSEIVERVGYADMRNFRKSFKAEFGSTPAEYRKNIKS